MLEVCKNEDVLQQNCRVGKIYPSNCNPLKLCSPMAFFDTIEQCEICKKTI